MFHFKNHIKIRTILIFCLVFACAILRGCLQPGTIYMEEWKVVSVNRQGVLFARGETIAFSTNKLHVNNNGKQKKYPCIVSDGRMLIETPLAKWLFEIEATDSVLVLRELYTKDPVEVKMIKSDKS
ncbi:MAG: hypothetical protein K9H26_17605 [Prolixibacteraceae bacterium]|nr:hypothetical protein [Prolixibacteraceae bacterium]